MSQILAGDAAVSGGVLPSTVSATEDADFQKRVQELRRVWGRRAVVRGNPKIEIMIRRVVRMIRMGFPFSIHQVIMVIMVIILHFVIAGILQGFQGSFSRWLRAPRLENGKG